MYRRKSNYHNLIILVLDCVSVTISLMLANYIRSGHVFTSDNERMNFGLLLGGCLAAFLALHIFHNMYRDIFLRGPFHELLLIMGSNIFLFAGAAILLYFMGVLDAYSRLAFVYFLGLDCVFMFVLHQLWKRALPSLYLRYTPAFCRYR